MRDPERIDRMVEALRRRWKLDPDLRLGQLVVNLVPRNANPFYVEDDWIEGALLKQISERTV